MISNLNRNGENLKILFVENHPHFAKVVIKQFLANHDVMVVTSVAEAKEKCRSGKYDLALVDFDLDDGKGDEFVLYVKSIELRLPIIACSSHEQGNVTMVQAGAIAICSKMDFKNINRTIENLTYNF